MSNAEVCRRRQWAPGTIIHIEDETGAARFVITAIGESHVLGKQLSSTEFGFGWSPVEHPYEQVIGVRLEDATAVPSAVDGGHPRNVPGATQGPDVGHGSGDQAGGQVVPARAGSTLGEVREAIQRVLNCRPGSAS